MVQLRAGAQQVPLQFTQPWRRISPPQFDTVSQSIDHDRQLLTQVINAERPPTISLQQHPQCLTVTVRESKLPDFAAAASQLEAVGWPVAVRCTGGAAVPQGPGVLNLALVHPKVRGWTLEDSYRLLCDIFRKLLAEYGLTAELGEVPGAFCDGLYNLQVKGQKLVGTAQRWAGSRQTHGGILAHACLLVDLDLVEATERINQLYRLCGQSEQFIPESCCCLRDFLPPSGLSQEAFVAEVAQRLANLVDTYFAVGGKETA